MQTATRLFAGGILVAALAAGTLGLAAAEGQEGKKAEPAAPAPAPKAGQDHAALVKSLGDPDFGARERAYEALRAAGESARGALEEGARSDDPQVAWASRRLLGLLPGPGPRAGRGPLDFGDGDEDGMGLRGLFPTGPGFAFEEETLDRAMEGLRRRMKELEERFRGMREAGPSPGRPGAGGIDRHVVVERDGERTEVHQGADGKVKVLLSRRGSDGGASREEVFEAPSLEALEKSHPDVYAKVKDLLGDRVEVRIGGGPGFPVLPPGPEAWGVLPLRPSGPAARPVLGVNVSEVPEVLRAQLSLPEGEGAVVEEVLPGTPAARMELRRHDVILAVNGIPVSSAADIRSAVAAVKEGGGIRLKVLRAAKVAEISGTR